MSLYFRPAAFLPVRCAPAVFGYQYQPTFNPPARDIFSFFEDPFSQLEAIARQQRVQFRRPFNPKFDVKEQDKTYLVEGELPGFDAKDISIEFLDEGHTLQIKGKTVSESTQTPKPSATAAVENVEAPKAAESAPADQSETASVKSHQATVEEVVEPSETQGNASATTESTSTEVAPEQDVAKTEVAPTPEEPKNHIVERYTGTFTRTFRFADKVDQEAVKASLKDGILAITLPFARKPESRRIAIE